MRTRQINQGQLAEAIGASRSAVNAWVNDRAYPQNWQIGALEEYLGIDLEPDENTPDLVADNAEVPGVMTIWADGDLDAEDRLALVVLAIDLARRRAETDEAGLALALSSH